MECVRHSTVMGQDLCLATPPPSWCGRCGERRSQCSLPRLDRGLGDFREKLKGMGRGGSQLNGRCEETEVGTFASRFFWGPRIW